MRSESDFTLISTVRKDEDLRFARVPFGAEAALLFLVPHCDHYTTSNHPNMKKPFRY